jgi:hypothetical protein
MVMSPAGNLRQKVQAVNLILMILLTDTQDKNVETSLEDGREPELPLKSKCYFSELNWTECLSNCLWQLFLRSAVATL